MNQFKIKTIIPILAAALILLIPIVALAADPPAPVPKTGQSTSYATFDDGYYQTGVTSPNPRFTDNFDGTVKDNLTGLVWLKNANCFETRTWDNAITDSNTLNSGECGLTDGSIEGDWRLPNYKELFSLVDASKFNLALPSGHPFSFVQSFNYWSSTTDADNNDGAWIVSMYGGDVLRSNKTFNHYVWPVRGPDTDNDGLDNHLDNCPSISNPDQKDVDSNNVGDVCDPNTVYGTITGDIQEGVSISINLISCGESNPVSTTTTDETGYYVFGGLANGSYAVIPENVSYIFNPGFLSVGIPQGNIRSFNFVASAIYTISGVVSGDVQEGVTITLSGDSSDTATTDAGGNYSFAGLINGSYTITPDPEECNFLPTNQSINIASADEEEVDFTAVCNPGPTTIEDLGMAFVSLNDGTFQMGIECPPEEPNCFNIQHTVTLTSPFKIGKYEVTQGQWKSVMGDNPSGNIACGLDCPVERPTWNEIQGYISTLNSQTGNSYRLCTNAEWEYAARAGTTTTWYCGDDESCVDDIAWYDANSGNTTHPVGQKSPNAWGLYDMSGNVKEFVQDWQAPYSAGSEVDPTGPETGETKTSRGGSYYLGIGYTTSAERYSVTPDWRARFRGFRLCMDE